ncbi:MAG TPA: patatin-like phospholipase family protein [Candidatus Faecicola pullistercoris]|nr:patatin-like phospholipase family protein [Candidatus Faecicola pullistercoris]
MLGLVLEGGGVKGAYHAGAIEALFEMGYTFDGVVGTSIGALNGAMLVQGDWERCMEIWDTITVSQIMDIDDNALEKLNSFKIDRSLVSYLGSKIRSLGAMRDASSEKMRNFIESNIDEDKIRKSKMDFGLVTFSVNGLQPFELLKEDIPVGKFAEYLIASANYPVYKLHAIDGYNFIDGGIWDNMPIKLLIKKNYEDFVVIRTRDRFQSRYEQKYENYNIKYIIPSEKLGTAMNFTQNKIQHYKKLGYFDAVRTMKNLMGKQYTIDHFNDNDMTEFMMDLPGELFKEALFERKMEIPAAKDEAVARFLSLIKEENNLSDDDDLARTMVVFLEKFARIYGIDKFKVYDMQDFVSAIYLAAREDVFDHKGKLQKASVKDADKELFSTMVKYYFIKHPV